MPRLFQESAGFSRPEGCITSFTEGVIKLQTIVTYYNLKSVAIMQATDKANTITHVIQKENNMELLELVTTLRDRYQVYAGEYRKPNLAQELDFIIGIPQFLENLTDNERTEALVLWLKFDEFVCTIQPTIEFLQHKEHFHPNVPLWYYCPDTTAAEFVVLMNECIAVLTGAKQCPSDKNNASSVSIVPES